MHHLCSYKIGLFFILAITAIPCWSQTTGTGNYNFREKENKPYYFGITLAFHTSNYRVFRSKYFNSQDQILTVESVTGPGYNVNVISNLKIGRYFDFRLLPGFSFTERNINYLNQSLQNQQEVLKIESVFVEIPFHARFKSEPYRDMRLFVLGGIKYGFDIASKARTRKSDAILKVAPTDFSLEVGFGMQFFFPYFILSPELKFSHGLDNILIFNEEIIQSSVLENVLSRTITLSFHFEG